MEKKRFLFLGCGGSMGVPVIGCTCEVCRSSSPFNKRLRCSGVLQIQGKNILIDVGPDFRMQALTNSVSHIDGVIITHTHYDHTGGLDDLRIFYLIQQKELPCLLSECSFEDIQKRYHYLFRPTTPYMNLTARFDFQIFPSLRGKVEFVGIPMSFMTYTQGGMQVNGMRIDNFAYVSDIREYPETIFEDLEGVETLVLSALRWEPSHLHFTLDDAIEFANRVGAKNTWLTHLAHELDYEESNAYLPPGIRLAYDGLAIDC